MVLGKYYFGLGISSAKHLQFSRSLASTTTLKTIQFGRPPLLSHSPTPQFFVKHFGTTSTCWSSPNQAMSKTEGDGVVIEVVNGKGIITLSRPKALNALNLPMIRRIYPILKEWESSSVKFVIIKGEGGKAFCAGGDIIAVTDSAKNGTKMYQEFFREEYMLNALIGTLAIPYVALIDGITMGGGVGLSVHGRYRVATEKTLFAMPETAIGLFPDVGGSYFLPRLGGSLGLYLALTGYRLKGSDNYRAGIATHMCHSEMLDSLEQDLISLDSSKPQDIESILKKYHDQSGSRSPFTLEEQMPQINEFFSKNSCEEILSALKSSDSSWAQTTAKTLERMSPTSMKITLEVLKRGANLDFIEALLLEYRLAIRCSEDHDFREGVRALLIDKDQSPKWDPDTLEKVTPQIVERYFSPLPNDLELSL